MDAQRALWYTRLKNTRLEKTVRQARAQIDRAKEKARKSLPLRIIVGFAATLLMTFVVPVACTGILTKGMSWERQAKIWTAGAMVGLMTLALLFA